LVDGGEQRVIQLLGQVDAGRWFGLGRLDERPHAGTSSSEPSVGLAVTGWTYPLLYILAKSCFEVRHL
jgi:hypothetical protein